METMEWLNILAATGMPGNVFGILTHLDLFRKPQGLRDAKKRLKHRLWAELYQGAHLFYLSGVINGRYPDREIHNLSRFLSVMKNPRPRMLLQKPTHFPSSNTMRLVYLRAMETRVPFKPALLSYFRGP